MKIKFTKKQFYNGYIVNVKCDDGFNRDYYHQSEQEADEFIKKFKSIYNKIKK